MEVSPAVVASVNTFERLACINGQYSHWVDGYDGERFSVIFYTVDTAHYTPPTTATPLPAYAVLSQDAPTALDLSDLCLDSTSSNNPFGPAAVAPLIP